MSTMRNSLMMVGRPTRPTMDTEETHPVTGANMLSFYTYFDPVEC